MCAQMCIQTCSTFICVRVFEQWWGKCQLRNIFCRSALTTMENTVMRVQDKSEKVLDFMVPALSFLWSTTIYAHVNMLLTVLQSVSNAFYSGQIRMIIYHFRSTLSRLWWPQAPQDLTGPSIQLNIMDQLDIYVNVESDVGNRGKKKSLVKYSNSIYENDIKIHTLEPNSTGPAISGNVHMQTGTHVYTLY